MTDDDHRFIGDLLGFPSCCVEAWIAHDDAAPLTVRTGVIHGAVRPLDERNRINAAVSERLGYSWTGINERNPHVLFIPCDTDCTAALALGRWAP